jgi:hypothetical protein
MASVTLAPAIAATDRSPAAVPAWWRRAHSYSLPLVIAGQIAATWLLAKIAINYEPALPALVGFVSAQSFLLGLWAALGGLPTIARWVIVGAVAALGGLATAASVFASRWENVLEIAPDVILISGALMAGFAAVLLPMRRLAGWRIDFDAAYYRPAERRRGQLAIMDFAAMFCAAAVPLTLCRVLIDSHPELGAGIALMIVFFGLIVLATAGPVARAVLAPRRCLLWLGGAAIWVVSMAWSQSLLALVVVDLNLFGSSATYLGLQPQLLAFHVGIAAAVAAPLLVLRCCDLKLLVVGA